MAGRKILVALDTSAVAARGIEHAAGLADALDAPLLLFCALDAPVKRGLAEFAEKEGVTLDDAAGEYLGRVARDLETQGHTVTYQEEESEDPAGAIVAYAKAHDIGMVVMTTHGRTGIGRQLMGSVTEEVLRETTVPVYVVPAKG
jgi:nucleotide-binding universal stress UspA family protein